MSITTNPPAGNSAWPDWFRQGLLGIWEHYLSIPQPKRTDEEWRYADLKAVDLERFQTAGPVRDAASLIARSSGHGELAAKFVFANDSLIHRETKALPPGVLLIPLEEAASDHRDLFEAHFMSEALPLGSAKFATLHRAHLRTGAFLHVPKGVTVEKPIEIWHWVEGDGAAVLPHTLVVLGDGASATVIDRFASAGADESLAIAVNDLTLGPGARLTYSAVQEWSDRTMAFHLNTTEVAGEATSTALQMNLGGAYVRGESNSRLVGEGARSVMLSVNPATGEREIDQRTFQNHFSPGATSDLLYHNALSDGSRTIFSGLIKVGEGAHETDAYQKVRNLMLSDEAEANSMPGLEILADNVRCTHGATSGELNEDELFYMQARGIPEKQAAQLITRGFLGSVLKRLDHPSLPEHLGGILDRKLGI